MTDTLAVIQPQRQSLTGFTPRDAKGLAWLANEVVKSGMFKVSNRVMTGSEAFVVMMKGAELGLTPMQSLAEISIIKGRPFVSKDVLTARITRSPRCVAWDPSDCGAKHCTIAFQVTGGEPTSLTTVIDDIPERYFKASSSGEPSNWTLVPEDMLFAWTVRRIARRFFPEALLDIGDAAQPDYDETKVINVAAVEREVGQSEFGTHDGCGGTWVLQSNTRTGGAFLRCEHCSATTAPPQEVRDLVRGTPEALTLAGPPMEDGERQPENGELDGYTQPEEVMPDGLPAAHETAPPPEIVDNGAGALDLGLEAAVPLTAERIDELVQGVITMLTVAKKRTDTRAAAYTALQAHGFDGSPVTQWLRDHAADLEALANDLSVAIEGALPA